MPYIRTRRLRGMRGLGAGADFGGEIAPLNCPGDPGCPGYVAPGSPEMIKSLQDELTALYQGQFPPMGGGSTQPGLLDWVKANPILAGAGVFVGALVLGKAFR